MNMHNNRIHSDVQKRGFALLLHAGELDRSGDQQIIGVRSQFPLIL